MNTEQGLDILSPGVPYKLRVMIEEADKALFFLKFNLLNKLTGVGTYIPTRNTYNFYKGLEVKDRGLEEFFYSWELPLDTHVLKARTVLPLLDINFERDRHLIIESIQSYGDFLNDNEVIPIIEGVNNGNRMFIFSERESLLHLEYYMEVI